MVHSETKSVMVVLENSAGGANSIGSQFEDLRGIIDHVKGIPVKCSLTYLDQSRVGVCIDTCHAFAAGISFFIMFIKAMIYGLRVRMKRLGNNLIKWLDSSTLPVFT